MAYTFDQLFAADPSNPANIAQDAAVTIFAPGDVTMTPIAITDPDGQPLANPITVNANGFGSAFAHATLDRVAWAGGGFTGFFTSYEGMKNEAVAARAAAETASTSAASSAALVGAPADTAIAAAINGTGATKTALDATYAAVSTVAAGATSARTPGDRASDEVLLDDFYVTADNSDWALTLERALAYAAPLGKHVRLKKIYPILTSVDLLDSSVIVGSGNTTGLKAPTDAPVSLINATSKSNIRLSNFLLDGGITAATTVKSYVRGVNITDCTNVRMTDMFVKNCADWAVSFVRGSLHTVLRHTHTGGGLGLPGGRDGLHFLDCADVLVDGADIDSGDDCVAITSETIGNSRITFRNINGKSDIGSVVVNNEEGATTFPTSDLTIAGITTKAPTRNIVRVQAINNGTVVSRVKITDVSGSSSTNAALEVRGTSANPMVDVTIANCNVIGQTHGLQLGSMNAFTLSGVNARSQSSNYDGFNLSSCTNGTIEACRSRLSALWGFQINACTMISVVSCLALECGGLAFAGNNGGGLRVVNSTDVVVNGGQYTGASTTSYYGISHAGNTRFTMTPETLISAANKLTGRIPGVTQMMIPAAAGRFKEDSGGVLTVQSTHNCTVTRNSTGNYTITPTAAFGGSATIFTATVGHPADAIKRRVVQRAAGTASITFEVIDDATGNPTYSEWVNFVIYDQP